jgi:hypothetical protein
MVQTLEKGTEQKAAQTHDTSGAVQVSNTEQAAYQTQLKNAQHDKVSPIGADGKMTIPPIQEALKTPTNPALEKSTDASASAGKVQPTDSKTTAFNNGTQITTFSDGRINITSSGVDAYGHDNGQKGSSLTIAADGTATATFPDGHTRPGPNGEEPIVPFSAKEMANLRSTTDPNGYLELHWNDKDHKISFPEERAGDTPAQVQANQTKLAEQQSFHDAAIKSIDSTLNHSGPLTLDDAGSLTHLILSPQVNPSLAEVQHMEAELQTRVTKNPDLQTTSSALPLNRALTQAEGKANH